MKYLATIVNSMSISEIFLSFLEEEMSNWYNLPLTTHNLSKRLNTNSMANDLSETDTDGYRYSFSEETQAFGNAFLVMSPKNS